MNLFQTMYHNSIIRLLILCALILTFVGTVSYFGYRYKKMGNIYRTTNITIPEGKIKKIVLKNGMKVVAFENPSSAKVLVQIAYNIGSAVEESGERGLAHLLEHLIFKGTDKLSETDIGAIARRYGAKFNAFTGQDITSYYFEVNKNNWKPFVDLLADCMQNARFHHDYLASEVRTIIQELRMHRDNYSRLMSQKAAELIFPPNHPYHDPVIGYKEDLLSITAQQVEAFYKKYYRPDRATLFIVGDVKIDEALSCAAEKFESIPIAPESCVKEISNGMPELITHTTRIFQHVKKERLGFYWAVPGILDDTELVASAFESLLGSGRKSRLYQMLVEEKKIATSVFSKNFKLMHGGIFFVFVDPVIGKSEKCRSIVQKVLNSIIETGFSDQEIVRMVNGKTRSFLQKMSNNKDFTYRWIKSFFSTDDEMEIFKRQNRYQQVTSEQLQDFAARYLDPFLMNQIEIVPVPENKREFIEASRKNWDKVERQILKAHKRTSPLEKPRVADTMKDPEPLDFTFPKPDRVLELENGLKIMLKSQKNWPIVAMCCRLKEAEYFARAREGRALGIMMSMLMEGSSGYTKKELVDFFEQRGVKYRFSSSGVSCTALAHDAVDVLERLAHIVMQPILPKESIDRIKARKCSHYYHVQDVSRTLAKRELLNLVYQGTPFSWTFDQAIQDLEHLTRADLIKLHQKYICPAHVMVSIVGDFDVDEMEKEARRIFSSWEEGGVYAPFKLPAASFVPGQQIDIPMLRNQVALMLGKPSPLTLYDDALIPIKMINSALFKSFGSRMYKLREQTGLFYSSRGKFAAQCSKFPGYDYVVTLVKGEQLKLAEEKICEVITQMGEHGMTEAELIAARQNQLKKLIDVTASCNRTAKAFIYQESLKLGFDYFDKVLQRVQTITLDEVNKAAAQYINAHDMARVRVGRVEGLTQ